MYLAADTVVKTRGRTTLGLGFFLGLALLSCQETSCSQMPAAQGGRQAARREPQVVLAPAGGGGKITVRVELARTPPEHTQGLMYRRELPPDHGMLFLFDQLEIRRFWMKNTYIPLDMIFLDDRRRVVGVEENTVPHDESSRGPDEPAQYVLEVPAGTARRHGIGPGARAEFINVE